MQNYIAMSSSLNIYRLSLHCSAFPGGGRGTTKWGMRRSYKILFFERSEKIFQKITSPSDPHKKQLLFIIPN